MDETMTDHFLILSLSLNAGLLWMVYKLVNESAWKSKQIGILRGKVDTVYRLHTELKQLMTNQEVVDQKLKQLENDVYLRKNTE